MSHRSVVIAASLALASLPAHAHATEPAGAEAGGSVSLTPGGASADGSAGAAAPTEPAKGKAAKKDKSGVPWMKRHRPTRQLEVGVFGGIMLPNKDHELYNPTDPTVKWQPYGKIAPDIGVRIGYYPLSFLASRSRAR